MNKLRVVVIEDEFPVAEDICKQLQSYEYEIAGTFTSAETALPILIESAPDIALVDIRLSGNMSGIELMQKVQPQFPFIYITANSDTLTYERARSTRPNAFLIKPFTSANLFASVDLAIFNYSCGQEAKLQSGVGAPRSFGTGVFVNETLFISTPISKKAIKY